MLLCEHDHALYKSRLLLLLGLGRFTCRHPKNEGIIISESGNAFEVLGTEQCMEWLRRVGWF